MIAAAADGNGPSLTEAVHLPVRPTNSLLTLRRGCRSQTRDVQGQLAGLLAQLVDAIPGEHHPWLLDWTIAATPETPGLTARPLRDLVNSIPGDVWTPGSATRAAARAYNDPAILKYAWLRAAARHLPDVRGRLADEARRGSVEALAALGPVTRFDDDLVADLIDFYAARVDDRIRGIKATGFSDGQDVDSLALLNIWHPGQARWEPLVLFLAQAGPDISLAQALDRLAGASLQRRLPDDVASGLHPVAKRLTSIAPDEDDPMATDYRPNARYLFSALERGARRPLDPETSRFLLDSGPDGRSTVAVLCIEPDPLGDGILTALLSDPNPHVRASAASTVTYRALRGDQLGFKLLRTLLDDPGTQVASAVTRELREHPTQGVYDVVRGLAQHPSALVRKQLAQAAAAITNP